MELPGLTKTLYGMTKAEALNKGVCIGCKLPATFGGNVHSLAGAREYSISGLCEDCFDNITGEEPMEITMHKQVGSDVEGVLNNDHAQAAEEYLRQAHFDGEWQVVVATDNMLMLDYDQREWDGGLPDHFFVALGIFDEVVGSNNYFEATQSKGGNTHCVIHMEKPMPITERIAWQAAFGSDPKREALHLLSVHRGEFNPILLFMRKPVEQKLLGDGNGIRQSN